MISDEAEQIIISRARQKNVRDPSRSRLHFENIFEDFFQKVLFEGKKLLDLGPGQFDFGVMARERGAICEAIDNDPAVLELGRYKDFNVFEDNLKLIRGDYKGYDGLFCKFSINAFWFGKDTQRLTQHAEILDSMLSKTGWAWIAPWNGYPKSPEMKSRANSIIRAQIDVFDRLGYEQIVPDDSQRLRWGINGEVANSIIFTKNL